MKDLDGFHKIGILFFTYFISQATVIFMLWIAKDVKLDEINSLDYLTISVLVWLVTFTSFKFLFIDYED